MASHVNDRVGLLLEAPAALTPIPLGKSAHKLSIVNPADMLELDSVKLTDFHFIYTKETYNWDPIH